MGVQQTELLVPAHQWHGAFREQRSLLCRDIFTPELLASLVASCRRTQFREDDVKGLGTREVEAPQRVGAAMNLMLSRAPFLRWVEAATDCGSVGHVEGRLVQTRANGRDRLDWHDDLDNGDRRLGITICLSDAPVEGGCFELRDKKTKELLNSHVHQQCGTALIFGIGPDVEHRLTPITAGGPRRVFSGWFFRGPVDLSA